MDVCGCWWDCKLRTFIGEKEAQRTCGRVTKTMGHENERGCWKERAKRGQWNGGTRLNENKCLKTLYSNLMFCMLLKLMDN